jgi:hypothetical protein
MRAFVTLLLVTVLAGCSGDDGSGGNGGPSGPDPPDPPPPPPPPEGMAIELVSDGLDLPIFLTAAPGDSSRLFVVQQGGAIRVIHDGTLLDEPFLDLSARTRGGSERGLLGLAFHPDYAQNGWFFVNHSDRAGDTQISRYTVSSDPDRGDPGSELAILSVPQPRSNHNGGMLAFGPDGMLYIGMGDGGGSGDPDGNGQELGTLLGSLLRIDVNDASADDPYAIPPDNPFVGDQEARPETWAYGLRNPWRFSFDRTTGDLYIGDVGQNRREEISFQPASSTGGENYGWNRMEGTFCFQPATDCSMEGLVLPVHDYGHEQGCSVTGGYVYRGTAVPELEGRYLFSDFCEGWISSFRVDDGLATDLQDLSGDLAPGGNVASFGEDEEGELYIVVRGGAVYRIVAGG